MKKSRYPLCAVAVILFCAMMFVGGCSKSLHPDATDGSAASGIVGEGSASNLQSTGDQTSKTTSLEPLTTFSSLGDLSATERESLSNAVSDICHFSFDTTRDDPNRVIYQGIIGPGASSFWNFHSTGDSEEDYRLFIKDDSKDPLRLFRSYGKFPAKDVDWILTNIYNMQPSHSSEVYDGKMYYYEDYYYVQWVEMGYDPHEVKLLSLKKTTAHTYEVTYEIYDVADPTYLLVSGTVTLLRRHVEEVPRWTYLQSQMQYAGYDESDDGFPTQP